MHKIRVVIAGVGSCASSLVQLVTMAKQAEEKTHGVAYPLIGGYGVKDIDFVGAFDVDTKKVGIDLSEAIFASPNSASKYLDVPNASVFVETGTLADGVNSELSKVVIPDSRAYDVGVSELTNKLLKMKADLLVCYLPTGAAMDVRRYAEAAANSGLAFINATPENIARAPEVQRLFLEKGVLLLGDDVKSLVGATTLHMALIELLNNKGIQIADTYQLNVGGNMDFLNLSDPDRSRSKVYSKRTALKGAGIDATNVSAGPNGYVAYLKDTKVCYLRLEGLSILGSQLSIETRLQVEDSPNSAGTIVDAIRIAKSARNKGYKGVLADPCAMLFKSPPAPVSHTQALRLFKHFVSQI